MSGGYGNMAAGRQEPDDDLYEGFNFPAQSEYFPPAQDYGQNYGHGGMQQFQQQHGGMPATGQTFGQGGQNFGGGGGGGGGAPPPTFGRAPPTQMNTRMPSRMGTSRQQDAEMARPMTSVKGAGYTSHQTRGNANRQSDASGRSVPSTLQQKLEGPDDIARNLEKKVNQLIEESAVANCEGKFQLALEKAKEAGRKERLLNKERERTNQADLINVDLTYAVCFNLANQYHANGMYTEALNSYTLIVKNKQYAQSGRLRVNMGNIYYEQKKYPNAIKMYRMALDQIPNTGREIRFKIMRNIGNSFVRLGQFQDAIQSFESIMEASGDYQTGFNLILCYYAIGDKQGMMDGFQKLLSIPFPGSEEDDDETEEGHMSDALKEDIKERQQFGSRFILLSAKLIAPQICPDWESGYEKIIENLRMSFPLIASELEIARAITYLKKKSFDKAIDSLKSFEKKEPKMMSKAATNLSFVYFHEGDIEKALWYAEEALKHDSYNAKALVNRANCYFVKEDAEKAGHEYQRAKDIETDCIEAAYNMGLVHKKLDKHNEALKQFRELDTLIPNTPEVVYQLGSIQEMLIDKEVEYSGSGMKYDKAINYMNMLHQRIPTDPVVLAKLGSILSKEDDESQAHQNFKESFDTYPVNMDVISWLGAYYVKSEVYEKAIQFFDRAAEIQPSEVKWRLMVASCHRRVGAYQQALQIYEDIHKEYPENVECLKYLVHICQDLGMKDQVHDYMKALRRAERHAESKHKDMQKTMQTIGGGDMDDPYGDLDTKDNFYTGATATQADVYGGGGGGYNQSPLKMPGGSSQSPSPHRGDRKNASRMDGEDEWGDEELGDDLLPL